MGALPPPRDPRRTPPIRPMEAPMWREPLYYHPPPEEPDVPNGQDRRRVRRAAFVAWALVALAAIAIVIFLV